MQPPNERGRITDPGEAHLMAALWEVHRREQEVLAVVAPHSKETTQEPGETERDVLRRTFTTRSSTRRTPTRSRACSVMHTASSAT